MNNLLERYLRQIKRYLPIKDRDETIEELRSLILDQLEQQTTSQKDEEAVLKQIIIEMGAPQDVAYRYNERGPLISREMEPLMKLIMKVTSITLPIVILFADSIAFVASHADFTFMDFLLNITFMIPSAMYSLVVGIGMIFIAFILIERFFSPNFSIEEKPFNPDLLPDLPQKAFHVSIFGSIVSILAITIVLYIVNLQPGLFSVYYEGGQVPLLNDNFDNIIPFLNIGWFVSILLHIYYLYSGRKNIPSKTIEFILGIYTAIILFLLATSDIFNDIIIEGNDLNIVSTIFKYVFIFIGIASIIGSIVEYVKMFVNIDNVATVYEKK